MNYVDLTVRRCGWWSSPTHR